MIAILGSGAVGALLGAELTRAGVAVTLVTTEASAEAIAGRGVTVASPVFGEHTEAVAVTTSLDRTPDVLVVAVKAPHLGAAIERVAGDPGVIVPLLNGIDHLPQLRARFPGDVVAGTVRVQAHRDGRTRVVHRAPFFTVTVAQPGVPALEHALESAGVDVARGGTEADVLWGKLCRLAGLALATTAYDAPLGEVRAHAEAVAREAAAAAVAEGAAIDAETIVEELRGLPDHASSSLRADVAAGATDHELDAIGGAVLRHAARHGLPAPETQTLVDRIGSL